MFVNPQFHLTNGNCSPPIRRFGLQKTKGKYIPVRSAVERLFSRAGCTGVRRFRKVETGIIIQQCIVPEKPNDVWTVDFKGWWHSRSREKVNPLTIRDEFSRRILAIDAVEKGDTVSVKKVFVRLFEEFGMPRIIRSDNGPPFANAFNYWGLTRLSVWRLSLGIRLDRITPGHPEQNGGHERMRRDMKRELQGQIDGTLGEHQNIFSEWLHTFNTVRPHEAESAFRGIQKIRDKVSGRAYRVKIRQRV